MRARRFLTTVLFIALGLSSAFGQDPSAPKKPTGLLGDLVTVDASGGVLTIRVADGSTATAALTGTTEYVRVQPGSKTLDGAEKISVDALAVGDRVWARGSETNGAGALVARQIVLMSAKAISEKRQQERREWQARGAFGTVTSVDAAKGEVAMKSNRGTDLIVAVAPDTSIMRMKPGARDLTGAEHIKLEELTVGAQIAVRGDGGPQAGRIAASEILTGTFPRPVRGRIASIDPAKREVHLTSGDGSATTVVVAADAVVRKLTPPSGQGREAGGVPGAPPAGAPSGGQRATTPQTDGAAPRGEGRRGGGPGGFGMLFGDRSELMSRTEALRFEELATGDFVFAVADPDPQGNTNKVSLVVKVVIPAGTPQRGPGGNWDLPTPPGTDFPN
jgi:hypothetical protein